MICHVKNSGQQNLGVMNMGRSTFSPCCHGSSHI